MKKIFLFCFYMSILQISYTQPKMQATMKPGITASTIDIYLKCSQSLSNIKDEAMTFVLAIRSTVSPPCFMDSSFVTPNGTGPVPGLQGLQVNFLVNNLGATSRQVVLTKEKIQADSFYVYTFIFSGTALSNHAPDWAAGVEQQIFSLQFSGCNANCTPSPQLLTNLTNGGINYNSYWYYQANTIGDITNYQAPFYANAETGAPVNGGSTDGSALSSVNLANPITISLCGTDASTCTWLGSTNSDWNNAVNWCGGVPSATKDAYIYPGAANSPSLNAGSVTARNVYLSPGSIVDLASGTLTIKGSITGTGTFSGTALSSLVIDGIAGVINFTPGNNILKSLIINSGGVATVGSVTIVGN